MPTFDVAHFWEEIKVYTADFSIHLHLVCYGFEDWH